MYKQDGMGEQEEGGVAKKGFAPFKQQRRRKKEKGGAPGLQPHQQTQHPPHSKGRRSQGS